MKQKNPTVLVVEDEISLQKAIKVKLKASRFNVLSARNVKEAFEQLKEKVDAVWLDHYLLGKENGLDLVAKIKKSNWKDIPIYVVSNTASFDKVAAYKNLGISQYYTKSNHSLSKIIGDIKMQLTKAT